MPYCCPPRGQCCSLSVLAFAPARGLLCRFRVPSRTTHRGGPASLLRSVWVPSHHCALPSLGPLTRRGKLPLVQWHVPIQFTRRTTRSHHPFPATLHTEVGSVNTAHKSNSKRAVMFV
ncbi:hypothetical protein P154DRAFT_126394 [Amniculicola lignicola CBS 123094]|uniref:Uncharacterized protein n=1 Tax=Amniculicola lignicola CBS 123094 TaxID=1392246 RepID=A0A6A5WZF3_9PLEO|nr:hypothetical protein P154DRAFT_126394 [Amniculicola lignicola CBS 123094]